MARRSPRKDPPQLSESELWDLVEQYLDECAQWERARVKAGSPAARARVAREAVDELYKRGFQLKLI